MSYFEEQVHLSSVDLFIFPHQPRQTPADLPLIVLTLLLSSVILHCFYQPKILHLSLNNVLVCVRRWLPKFRHDWVDL